MRHAFLEEDQTRQELASFVLTAPRLSMDQKCAEFERAFASFQGRGDAILFNSGGSANLAMLQALKNLGRLADGDRIGFSCLTWSTNTMPILQLGMVPVAIDVDPSTMNVMSAQLLDRLAQTSMRAFFVTNVLGLAGDMAAIREICDQRGIILLEDNCESLGTELPEGRTGNFGVASSFSFYVAHHMSTIEGGMVCTDDAELGEMLRIVRANGWDRNLAPDRQTAWRERFGVRSEFEAKYAFYDLGYNLRPTEITGFLGLVQLRYLPDTIAKRASQFDRIQRAVASNSDLMALERKHLRVLSSFAFPVICRSEAIRDRYVKRFEEAGIEIRPIIAGNMQRQPFYAKYVPGVFDVRGAEFLHRCGFYSGNYPELTEDDLRLIESCLQP